MSDFIFSATAQRKAILEFFDAFARGDDQIAGEMMTLADQYELEDLVETGEWEITADLVTEVLLETGTSPHGMDCVLAIFEVGDSYQPQLWYYTPEGNGFVFEAVSASPKRSISTIRASPPRGGEVGSRIESPATRPKTVARDVFIFTKAPIWTVRFGSLEPAFS